MGKKHKRAANNTIAKVCRGDYMAQYSVNGGPMRETRFFSQTLVDKTKQNAIEAAKEHSTQRLRQRFGTDCIMVKSIRLL